MPIFEGLHTNAEIAESAAKTASSIARAVVTTGVARAAVSAVQAAQAVATGQVGRAAGKTSERGNAWGVLRQYADAFNRSRALNPDGTVSSFHLPPKPQDPNREISAMKYFKGAMTSALRNAGLLPVGTDPYRLTPQIFKEMEAKFKAMPPEERDRLRGEVRAIFARTEALTEGRTAPYKPILAEQDGNSRTAHANSANAALASNIGNVFENLSNQERGGGQTFGR